MDWSSFPIGNAAGFVKGPGKEFDDLLRSQVTHITLGSFTLDQRLGNEGEVYFLAEDGTSVNALGMPNPGINFFLRMIGEMIDRAKKAGKRIRVSVAGFSPEEVGLLIKALADLDVDIEINLGCPNVWSSGVQKTITSFDLEAIRTILRLNAIVTLGRKIDLKVSPYSDPRMIVDVATLIKYAVNYVDNLVACNTYPNGLAFRKGKRVINVTNGYGGIGGNAMHHIALGQVSQFADALNGFEIGIWGVGGVDCGERLTNMRLAGATGVQVGTAFNKYGGRIFSDMLEEVVSSDE